MRNIILIGFMGSGKTMTSKQLAQKLNRPVLSTDVLIEQKEGRSITDIFEQSGEEYFRKIEKEVIAGISDQGAIIDCGGGVVLDPENITNLKKNGLVIYLSASVESNYENIKKQTGRPLLQVEDPKAKMAEIFESRKSNYKCADVTIDADYKTIDQITEAVLKVVERE